MILIHKAWALAGLVALLAACSSGAAAPTVVRTDSVQAQESSSAEPAGSSVVCRFKDDRLVEISGLASSIRHPGVLWTHNDSGDSARVFAVDSRTCQVLAVVNLRGVKATDMEAIAVGRDSGGTPVIWAGDIGDNNGNRASVQLYRFPEPAALSNSTVDVRSYSVTYSDGPHDAEGLLVDPVPDGRLWIVSKGAASESSFYALPANFTTQGSGVAKKVGRAPWVTTDAAYAPDRNSFIVRSYVEAEVFSTPPPGESIRKVAIPLQPQGEAITFGSDSRSVFIASERSNDLIQVPLS